MILWMDSFELDADATSLGRRYPGTPATVPGDVTYRWDGGRHFGTALKSGASALSFTTGVLGNLGSELGVHCALLVSDPPAEQEWIQFRNTSTGVCTSLQIWPMGTSEFRIVVVNSNDDYLMDSGPLPQDEWIQFQIYGDFTASGSLIIDYGSGTPLKALSADLLGASASPPNTITFNLRGLSGYMAMDDLVITDGELLGDVTVEPAYIIADGDQTDWATVPATGAGTRHTVVDEALLGLVDDDATRMETSNPGDLSIFRLYPLGRSRHSRCFGMQVTLDAALDAAGSEELRLMLYRDGEFSDPDTFDVNSTSYQRKHAIVEADPFTGAQWLPDLFDSTQVGVRY